MNREYSNWDLFRDLYEFLKPYRLRFVFSTLIRVVGDIAWLYPAYALATIITFLTAYHGGQSLRPIFVVFALFFVAAVIRYFGGYISKMIMFKISERIDLDSQMAAINHMFKLDMAWHERENTGNKLKKIVRGSDSIDRILRIWINNIVLIIINLIGITIVIARFDRTIALLTLVFFALYYFIAKSFRTRAKNAAAVVNLQEEQLEGLLFESLNNIRSVKVLGMGQALMKILWKKSNEMYEKVLRRIFWFQIGGYSRGFFAQVFELGMFGFIVYGIIHGNYGVGFLVLFSSYFSSLLQSVGELADVSQDYVVARLSVGRMVEVLNEPIQIDRTEGKVSFPSDWKRISFKDVSFGYGDTQVLENISFEINRGEKVGIVGLSGAGKSTIFKLLLKEHESYSGEILIDETPLKNIEKQDYFKYSAVVLQDTEVFNLSLKENIILANSNEGENNELFEKAARVAHVQNFSDRLPDGINSVIGEKGIRLSGGERQRVGIARAVFKNSQLLLLDEATSHLDIESEEKIRLSLHEFFQSVTAIVIAHRLTTIREMDRIIVLENGKIIEEGSFDDLYEKRGRFHELWEKQSL
jgi:ABC-type multidrug transport system fused ATPase/permease subunit